MFVLLEGRRGRDVLALLCCLREVEGEFLILGKILEECLRRLLEKTSGHVET
jgi:hypothetical protein